MRATYPKWKTVKVHNTICIGKNYCIERVRIENNSDKLFGMKHGTHHYLIYIILLKWLALKQKVKCLKLPAKLNF